MSTDPSSAPAGAPSPWGSRSPLLFAAACVVAVGAWWVGQAREQRALTGALAPYASASLPSAADPVDEALADLGARVFDAKCAGCHHMSGEPRIGPNLAGITLAREASWLAAMIQRPDSMTRHDPIARALLDHYEVRMMVAGGMDGAETVAVLEFMRRADGGASTR